MKKRFKEILDTFDNAYGGDVLIHESENQYLHFSYEEISILLKKLKKKDRFKIVRINNHFQLVKIKRHPIGKQEGVLTVSELLGRLLEAKKPDDISSRKEVYTLNSPCEERFVSNHKKIKRGKIDTKKPNIRFDWHDHYLEGLRIHGNMDDAEAYADEMKRKLLGKI